MLNKKYYIPTAQEDSRLKHPFFMSHPIRRPYIKITEIKVKEVNL
jgi:hypothetical protein